jgi:hypothetical protein
MEPELRPEVIRKRVRELRNEIAAIQAANTRYATLSHRSPMHRQADRERKDRLQRIVQELASLTRANFSKNDSG